MAVEDLNNRPEWITGQNIRYFRKQKKLTQDALADLLYIDRAAISRYENGSNGIMGIDVLLRFCQALEVQPNDLLLPRTEMKQENLYEQLDEVNKAVADQVISALLIKQQAGA